MKFLKIPLFFCVGGLSYVGLELLWRGRSHKSMFFAGGSCFLLLGSIARRNWKLPARALVSTGIITAVELVTGLLANRQYRVWDYRNMPYNYRGQICLLFSCLWIPVGLTAMSMYRRLDKAFQRRISAG